MAEIVEALRAPARQGLDVEPTSAVAAAGLSRLLASGVIRPQEYTVLVLTGSGLKGSATTGEAISWKAFFSAGRQALSVTGENRYRTGSQVAESVNGTPLK